MSATPLLASGEKESVENNSAAFGPVEKSEHTLENEFFLDSDASHHMKWNQEWLRNVREINRRSIAIGNRDRAFATHRGTLFLRIEGGIRGDVCNRNLVYEDVLYVPRMHFNLISCPHLCDTGHGIKFGRTMRSIISDGIIQLQDQLFHGVRRIVEKPVSHGINYYGVAAVSKTTRMTELKTKSQTLACQNGAR